MYSAGEIVVYGRNGVCRVEEVVDRAVGGTTRTFYVLRPLYQDCRISTPTEGGKIAVRPAMSREEADALIDSIPLHEEEAFFSRNLTVLKEHYREIMESQDRSRLLGLTISLYRKRADAAANGRKFGVVDERFMKEAEELLFGELAFALGIGMGEVPAYIEGRMAKLGVK